MEWNSTLYDKKLYYLYCYELTFGVGKLKIIRKREKIHEDAIIQRMTRNKWLYGHMKIRSFVVLYEKLEICR